MKAVVIAAGLLLIASPASACHRFSRWSYPWPQRCGGAAAQRPLTRIAALEVAPPKPAPGSAEPIPSLPAPSNEDLDAEERAQAIERLKAEFGIRAASRPLTEGP
jgi:hypothetical protein